MQEEQALENNACIIPKSIKSLVAASNWYDLKWLDDMVKGV